MTKLGLISDIHADAEALQLALDLLRDKGADQIICAGDLVEKGMYDDEAVELIQTKSIPCVRGNHDDHAMRVQDSLRKGSRVTRISLTHQLYLKDETLAYLKLLPKTHEIVVEDQRILIAHGTPWNDSIYIFPKSEYHVFRRITWEAKAKLVNLGQTHVPRLVWVNNTWIANPGSVCGTFTSGSRTCGLFSLDDASFQVFNIANGKPVDVPYIRSRPS
ncbi:MAG: metallophosphoesterase family protein [Anaerolineae bacterium]|nr:metallophosphoesterase family protein [Anaerolineae bacterium]